MKFYVDETWDYHLNVMLKLHRGGYSDDCEEMKKAIEDCRAELGTVATDEIFGFYQEVC